MADSLPLRQIERTSAADMVREQLLALIESGELAVGDKLPSEHELARSFGVSRPIIREGLGALRAAGVIESRSGSGTFVTASHPVQGGLLLSGRYSPEDLHEVRADLEVPGAGVAARRRTPEQLEALAEIVDRHASRTRAEEWVEDDLAFHVMLAEASGNPLRVNLVRELREVQREQNIAAAAISDLDAPHAEHGEILAAVRKRDARRAERAMAAHLDAILARGRAATDSPEGRPRGSR
jgi:DNA-binding FadR family transcriptional regulator